MPSYGYIRQSRRADQDITMSYDAQLAAIRRLAIRYGDDPNSLTVFSDLGRSGAREKTHLRTSYQQLVSVIKSNGHGTTIYALSMSRLARSLTELLNIFTLASEHGVRIVFEKEGEVRFDTPIGKLHATITSAVYEFERELAVERQRDNVAIRRARGDRMGRVPYGEKEGEDISVIVAAYRQAGSFNGAARILNESRTPSWSGKPWTPSGVESILRRVDPSIRSKPKARGAKRGSNTFSLYRLLRCHCGKLLTASRDGDGKRTYYRCTNATNNPTHGKPYLIPETTILPLVQEEIGDIRNLVFVSDREVDQQQKADLTQKRNRVVETFIDGIIDKQERDQRLLDIDKSLGDLETKQSIVTVPDWDDEPQAINEFLRALFGDIQLDAQLQPTFDWKIKVRSLRDKVPTQAVVRTNRNIP